MRNVVMITLDALRADHCGFHGYERDTTPTLDSMAEGGLQFERAVAPGTNTPSSMSSIFTGEHSLRDVSFDPAERWREELTRRETVAESLSDRGYATGAIHPQVHASRHFGFDSGFDHFEDFLPAEDERSLYSWVLDRMFGGDDRFALLRNARSLLLREEALKPWEAYYDDIVDWASDAEEPFFLWTLLPDTHFPYLPPSSHRRWSTRRDMLLANYACYSLIGERGIEIDPETRDRMLRLYDDTIRYSDAFVRRLWADLEEFDPVFVVHADHGEAFGEHGFYGHLSYPYAEVSEVPLIVYNADCSGTVEQPFSLLRIGELIEEVATTGAVSELVPDEPGAMTKVVRDGSTVAGLRTDDWTYVRSGDRELYAAGSDEQDDRSGANPDVVDALDAAVDARHRTDLERESIRTAVWERLDGDV